MSDLRVPTIYARVAAEPGDFALLELPPGWRNGARVAGKQDVVIMSQLWNQTAPASACWAATPRATRSSSSSTSAKTRRLPG